jgi:hypothetical protein
MKMNFARKKLVSAVMAGILGIGISFTTMPVPEAHADFIGAILAGVQGAAAYAQVDKALDHYNNTEEGRQELLKTYKEKLGVNYDGSLNGQLSTMMDNLTGAIGSVDNTIYNKPYLYFINNDTSFNAFCSMGHVMSVNTGMYSMTTNPDEIAVVLLHEMGHGQKDHVVSAARKKMRLAVAAGVISGAAGSSLTDYLLNILVNQIDSVQITKSDEWEADNLSLTYLLHSGYNPGASAAMWQRVMDRTKSSNSSAIREVFSPSDHPTNKQRRDNYAKRLSDLTGGDVKDDDGVIKIGGKEFVTPAASGDMSAKERSYFVMGNLVRAYQNHQNQQPATSDGSTVYLGNQAIMTSVNGDPDANTLAQRLNTLKSSKSFTVPDRELELEADAKPKK